MTRPVDVPTCRALLGRDGEGWCKVGRFGTALVNYAVAQQICRGDDEWRARLPTMQEWARLARAAVGAEDTERLLLDRWERACRAEDAELLAARQGIRRIERGFEWLAGRDQARLPCESDWPGFKYPLAAREVRRLLRGTNPVAVDEAATVEVRCVLERSQ
jgi:hypothetical protein